MKKKISINFIISIISQICILACAIILPKIPVFSLGSEANGYLSTITGIFSYVALVEGGLGLALHNALYEPIEQNDTAKISVLLSTTQRKYRRVSVLYLTVSVVASLILPLLLTAKNLTYSDMSLSIIA